MYTRVYQKIKKTGENEKGEVTAFLCQAHLSKWRARTVELGRAINPLVMSYPSPSTGAHNPITSRDRRTRWWGWWWRCVRSGRRRRRPEHRRRERQTRYCGPRNRSSWCKIPWSPSFRFSSTISIEKNDECMMKLRCKELCIFLQPSLWMQGKRIIVWAYKWRRVCIIPWNCLSWVRLCIQS